MTGARNTPFARLALLGAAAAVGTLLWRCSLKDGARKDQARAREPVESPRLFTEEELNATNDVVGYARYCKQELGLPNIPLEPWNCLDGTEIPVTIEGKPLTDEVYADLAAKKLGCDIPSWLGDEPCANYAFVQRRALSDDVDATLLCRMRTFTSAKDRAARKADLDASPTLATFNALYKFDSLGLIWTNKRTGKTCFFDFVAASFGGLVPSPDDDRIPEESALPSPPPPEMRIGGGREVFWQRDARSTWRAPTEVAARDNCVRCHDAGPYQSSPWIAQTFDVPANDPEVPYVVVGSAFDEWRKRFPPKAISTDPIARDGADPEPQACTTCHRIGSQATCERFVGYASGRTTPGQLSNLGRTFFYRTWMPPPPADWHGKTESELKNLWDRQYDRHLARLKCCCETPRAKGCRTQDLGSSPLPEPVAGTGPETCP